MGERGQVTYLEILEQMENAGFDIQRIEPQCEYSCLPLTLGVEVFHCLRLDDF